MNHIYHKEASENGDRPSYSQTYSPRTVCKNQWPSLFFHGLSATGLISFQPSDDLLRRELVEQNFSIMAKHFQRRTRRVSITESLVEWWNEDVHPASGSRALSLPCEDEELSNTVREENKEFTWLMYYAENGFMESIELGCNKLNNENI